MTQPDIFTLWKKSNAEADDDSGGKPLNIENFFKPRVKKNTLPLKINIYTYLVMQLSGIMISSYDLSLFISNPRMLIIVSIFILIFTFSMFYGIDLLFRLRRSEYDSRDLLSSIKSRIKLYRINIEVWLWLCSATAVILPLVIVFIPDSVSGTYVIHNVTRFATISLIMFIGIYIINKISIFRAVYDLKAYYTDIIEGSTDITYSREKWLRKYRIVFIIFFFVLFIMLLLFALKGLFAYKSF